MPRKQLVRPPAEPVPPGPAPRRVCPAARPVTRPRYERQQRRHGRRTHHQGGAAHGQDQPARQGPLPGRRDHQGRPGRPLQGGRPACGTAPARPAADDGAAPRRHRRQAPDAEERPRLLPRVGTAFRAVQGGRHRHPRRVRRPGDPRLPRGPGHRHRPPLALPRAPPRPPRPDHFRSRPGRGRGLRGRTVGRPPGLRPVGRTEAARPPDDHRLTRPARHRAAGRRLRLRRGTRLRPPGRRTPRPAASGPPHHRAAQGRPQGPHLPGRAAQRVRTDGGRALFRTGEAGRPGGDADLPRRAGRPRTDGPAVDHRHPPRPARGG